MNLERIRQRLVSFTLGRAFLSALSALYRLGVELRYLLYRLGIKHSRKLHVRVICMGNLAAGGTGKTSAALLAASELSKRGKRVAVISRGYKRKESSGRVLVLDEEFTGPWEDCGDEAWMIHHTLRHRNVPVVVSRNRFLAGRAAIKRFHPDVLIMDDGFQHSSLKRNVDVVLLHAADPFAKGFLLPRGNLREPVSALKRATLIVLTHADQVNKARIANIRREISRIAPDTPVLESIHEAAFLFDVKNRKRIPLRRFSKIKIAAFSGIGDPKSFEKQLRNLGAVLEQIWRYPDHHPYTRRDLESIETLRKRRELVTTFKDLARFPLGWQDYMRGSLWALAVQMRIPKEQDRNIWEQLVLR